MVQENSAMLGGIGILIYSCSFSFGCGFLFKIVIWPWNEISEKSLQFTFSLASSLALCSELIY